MRSLRGNDQSVVRALNKNAVLNLLHRAGPLSRANLKDRSGLSGAAISAVVAELMDDGLVEEQDIGPSTGGRPPVMLRVNYAARAAVGIKLMERELAAVLVDLGGRVQGGVRLPLAQHTPDLVARVASQAVEHLLSASGLSHDRLAGIGMGLPGVIDSARGVCVRSSYLGWQDVPIAALLEARIGAPAFIDNDVNAFAAAERLFGHGKGAAHLAVVTVGRGIGAGLVLNGAAHRGRDGGAGELGHVVSDVGGRPCECGKRGCLEAYASEPALVARAREAGAPVTDVQDLLMHAHDERVASVLRDGGTRVGVALANLVNLVNPELVVIGGEGVRLGPLFFDALRAALREHAFDGLARNLPVVVEPWGDDAWARGAASLAVSRVFDLEVSSDV